MCSTRPQLREILIIYDTVFIVSLRARSKFIIEEFLLKVVLFLGITA